MVFQLILPIGKNIVMADVTDVIDQIIVDEITITNSKNEIQDIYSPGDRVRIDVKWSIKSDNVVKAGDTFTMKLPKELKGFYGTINLNDDVNKIYFGKGEGKGDIITFTLSQAVETLHDIKASFFIQSEIKLMDREGEKDVPLIFELAGKAYTKIITIDTGSNSYQGGGYGTITEIFEKWGKINENDPTLIDWQLRINWKGEVLYDVILTDQLGSGHEFVNGSFKVYMGYTNRTTGAINNGTWLSLNSSNLEYSSNTLKLKIGNTNGKTYQVYYQTRINDKNLEDFKNNATLFANSKEPINREVFVKSFESGGFASGKINNGTLKIIKKDEVNSELLSGAKFHLINDKGQITEVTTNEYGEAFVNDILGGIYTLKESEAPKGYELNSNLQTINLDFKQNKVIEKVVTNKKSLKPLIPIDIKQTTMGSIKIVKVDKNDTNKLLDGAKFKIKGISDYNKNIESSGSTYTNGQLVFKNLPYGKYILTEIEAPKGYIIDNEEKEIEIKSDNKEVKVQVLNEKETPSVTTPTAVTITPKDTDKKVKKKKKPKETIDVPDEDIPQGDIKIPEKTPEKETINVPEEDIPQGGIKIPEKNPKEETIEVLEEGIPQGKIKILPKTGETSNTGIYLLGILSIAVGIFLKRRTI